MLSKETVARISVKLSSLTVGAIPILLFAAILSIPIRPAVSRALSAYSLLFFFLVLSLYYLSFRWPARHRGLAAGCLTALLLALTLSFLWHSAYSDDKVIGGLLPFRDAFDYYNGANWILSGHPIKILNEGASWRPLYPGFLSALLWITGRNLQWALAIQVALAGLCFSLSALSVRDRFGAAAAALYMTLLYFYSQPLVGTAYTETLGLALGCLGFILLLEGAAQGLLHTIMGLMIAMLAVSARAGAFFVFPMLVVWAGWAWRGQGRFSLRHAGIALATVVVGYLIFDTAYSKVMVEPGGSPFGNFAFTLYGQVAGGAGYHKAFEDLAVRDPAVILRAAQQFFVAHPASFALGAAKSYRDFFSPQSGVFGLGSKLEDGIVWLGGTLLMVAGLYRAVKHVATATFSVLLAGFIGIFLSIPFLPPIDGGIRIYASTMPFILALAAAAVGGLLREESTAPAMIPLGASVAFLGTVLALLTVLVPVALLHLTPQPMAAAPHCPPGQAAFAAQISAGSYLDLVPDGSRACGTVPEICVAQLAAYGATNDPSDALVFDQLAASTQNSPARVFVANDLINGRPHFFVAAADQLQISGMALVAGCATETRIKGRPSIYTAQTIAPAASTP